MQATMIPAEVERVYVKLQHDDDPDLSHLGDPQNYLGLPVAEIERYVAQDRARLDAYNRGDWQTFGVILCAEVKLGEKGRQTVTSGGIWGVESDSEPDYFLEVARDQSDELKLGLEAIGFAPDQAAREVDSRLDGLEVEEK